MSPLSIDIILNYMVPVGITVLYSVTPTPIVPKFAINSDIDFKQLHFG
jgi:hypothetical protein